MTAGCISEHSFLTLKVSEYILTQTQISFNMDSKYTNAYIDMTPEELKAAFPDPIGSFYFTDYASSYLSKIGNQKKRREK